ncbi:stachyose synthase [Amaranthus tricolor]|uniref:stachyose synthase n=1 Tax=Amaranthus tricolor TaxID=29722 RepID=UPI0025835C18|nr:stachyose synthase [Amaranthus tricolor]
MAPPNDPVIPISLIKSKSLNPYFDLSEDGKFTVKGVTLLSEIPNNVSFTDFSSICKYSDSDAPFPILQRVQSTSHRGGFFGFQVEEPAHRVMNSLGRFHDRNFLSIFRFKTWWSTQCVGKCGSDLQMETQWVLFDVPEIRSYVLIVPLIEGSFRAALNPGDDGHVMICAESGSSNVKESIFKAIAYVHVCDNPYNIMKEAFSALRVYLNTFSLLEEKGTPTIMDRFGWCTWDAFYLSVEPKGIFHGVDEFSKGGLPIRFLIIDDGWQSINCDDDNPYEDRKGLVLGGEQMTARLHRFNEGEKFRNYKGGSLLGPNSPPYNPMKPKLIISKAIEIEHAEKDRARVAQSGVTPDLSTLDEKIKVLKQELDGLLEGEKGSENDQNSEVKECGMKAFTKDLKSKFKGLDDIWVWHALCGAWGGVRPKTTHFNVSVIPCKLSPGLAGTMDDLAVDKIVEGGIGLVHPDQAAEFYDFMHSYLSSVGITGVKVDVIHTLEYVSEQFGGRVELAKKYYNGLSKSLRKNFKGTNLLSSMEQCNDFLFLGTKQISMGRVGDDFWFQDPNGDPNGVFWLQGVHMIHCSYNSLWMGQVFHPDWDMFQSDHVCAKFHAGSRAICGGPIYVSDSLGGHDFDLLKKLVYPDGTIPKCQHFALPTRDVLFENPLFDQKTILKIWNFNKYGAVLGAFNCQGAGWDRQERRIKGYKECYKTMEGLVHVNDIEWDQTLQGIEMGCAEEYAVYINQKDSLLLVTPKSDPIQVKLNPSSFELFTFVPIKKLGRFVRFASIGLTNMFNSGGTIRELEFEDLSAKMKVKGVGSFLAYSNEAPKKCIVNGEEVQFEWSNKKNKLVFDLPWIEENGGVSQVIVQF